MKTAVKMLIYLILIIIGIYVAIAGYLYFNQRNLIFIPMKELAITPADLRIPFEEVSISIDDITTVHGWYMPGNDTSDKKVVLFCHGNAGNISHRVETIWLLHQLGVGSFFFDYRGFGNSTGQPDEQGVYADAEACYDWLLQQKNFTPEQIYIFGRSLGGAVAVDVASKKPCAGLIVESSFTSTKAVAKKLFPYFPIAGLLKYHFNSAEKISKVNCPVLITHSPEDDIIPYQLGERLFEEAVEPKQFFQFSGRHNDRQYIKEPAYQQMLASFLRISGNSAGEPEIGR